MSAPTLSDKLVAAVADGLVRVQAQVGSLVTEVRRLRDAVTANTAELRELTDASKGLAGQVAPVVAADEARGRAMGKIFDRITRLTLMQAVSMLLGSLAAPVFVAGLVLALSDPREVLSVVLRVLPGVSRSEPPPPALTEDP